MDKVKSCPFCGGEAELVELRNPNEYEGVIYEIVCWACFCRTTADPNRERVIGAWNRRAPTGLECCGNCGRREYYDTDICPHIPTAEIPGLSYHCRHWRPAPAGWRREIEVE